MGNEVVTIEQEIIWGDMDAYNHINNTVYFRYFESVRIVYFEGVGINQWMEQNKVGPILGETSCRFLKPLHFPDKIQISTRVTHLRDKRFTMEYRVYSEKSSACVAEGMGEIVFVDYKSGKTCSIPETIRSAIIRTESNNPLQII